MKYVNLGKSDLKVSRICMGCMGFGNSATGQHSWTVDEAQTREIIRHGLDLGINFFDTAIVYQNGTSEHIANYLEELYIPHELAGVMAQNGKQKAGNVI